MSTLTVACAVSSPALAMGLCVAMIAFVRLPSLKVSCLLLSGLLIYDVFWVSVCFPLSPCSPFLIEAFALKNCWLLVSRVSLQP